MKKLINILQNLTLIFIIGGSVLLLISLILLMWELDNFAFILMKTSITIMILGYVLLPSFNSDL